MNKTLKILLILFGSILLAVLALPLLAGIMTEIWWWDSEGYLSVLLKTGFLQVISFIIPFLIGISLFNLWLFGLRRIPRNKLLSTLIVLVSLAGGVWGWMNWDLYVWNLGFPSTGFRDPIFRLDAYFYMYRLPLLNHILILFLAYFGALLAADIFLHRSRGRAVLIEGRIRFDSPLLGLAVVNTLISVILVCFRLFEALVRQPHPKLGIGYSTVYGYFLGYAVYLGALIVSILWLYIHTLRKGTRPRTLLFHALGLTLLFFLATRLYPSLVEKTQVIPNELFKQKQFIQNRMDATRFAFNLGLEDYQFEHDLRRDLPEIFSRSRIWDADPYLKVIRQRQEIKSYFQFLDTDVDMYTLSNQRYQVVLAARELNTASLPPETLTWDNRHLRYTHGYGLTLSPANRVDAIGGPEYWVRDLANISSYPELHIAVPQIYYGELTSNYIIVRTTTEEFEYTADTNRLTTVFSADRGVSIGNFFRRVLFAIRYRESKILFTQYLTRDSRILFRRLVLEKVRHLFPYLQYDHDPYITIVNGRLYWILDAYSGSDRFPIAQRFDTGLGRLNYLRNPVKVVVDAYSGETWFHITDRSDAIIQAYSFIYPELFSRVLPEGLEDHFRYPTTLFQIQADILATYHVDNLESFYNGEDAWKIPEQIYGSEKHPFRPYYLLAKIAGDYRFALINPYNPIGKENLSAWLLAYYDQGNHLALKYLDRTTAAFGPLQVESTIDQDENLSRLFALWNQRGSQVFRGNIQFIPLDNDILYLESIFLESAQTSIPQLVRIIAVINGRVFSGRDFQELLFSIGGQYDASWNTAQGELQRLEQQLIQAYRTYLEAESHRIDGNLNAYQKSVDKIGEILKNSLP